MYSHESCGIRRNQSHLFVKSTLVVTIVPVLDDRRKNHHLREVQNSPLKFYTRMYTLKTQDSKYKLVIPMTSSPLYVKMNFLLSLGQLCSRFCLVFFFFTL